MTKKIKRIKIALIYDFDGTLSPDNIQEHAFIKAIGDNKTTFWEESKDLAENNDASPILCYMHEMVRKAEADDKVMLTRQSLKDYGKDVQLYSGVKEWFKLIKDFGNKLGVEIEHYINSSGLKEMIEGTPIFKEFKQIYACSFLYDRYGKAKWPAVAVDYTAKTQFLFKINKGIASVSDNTKVNEFMAEEDRPIPFCHMIYLGDGDTDVPCMKLVKDKGGYSIAVYNEKKQNKEKTAAKLIKENRVNFICPANYLSGMELHNVICTIIKKIKADFDFKKLQDLHKGKTISRKNKTEQTDNPSLLD